MCLAYLFHCTHRRFYNTLSARKALVSVESTTPQILFTYVAWNLTDKKIFSFHLKIFVLLIFSKQICICCCITVYHHLQKQNGTDSKFVENLIAKETSSELQLAELGLKNFLLESCPSAQYLQHIKISENFNGAIVTDV